MQQASSANSNVDARMAAAKAKQKIEEPEPPEQRRAVFTTIAVIACTTVMGMELRQNAAGVDFGKPITDDCHFRMDFHGQFCAAALSINPLFGPAGAVLVKMGGVSGARIVDQGEVWRLGAAMFLHGGVLHLLINMAALLGVGRQLEHIHGSMRVGCIYTLSGLYGAIASATFAPETLSVGASGAIFGLIGACLGDIIFNWDMYPKPCASLIWLTFLSAFQLVLGTMPLLDNFAHTFGFGMGLVSSLLFLKRLNPGRRCVATCSRRLIRLIAAICVFLSFSIAFGVMYGVRGADANELCPQCSKISCMPFPWGCDVEQPGACWWTCDTAKSPISCTGRASFSTQPSNGTVEIGCSDALAPIVLHPMDISGWSDDYLAHLCRDLCD